MSILTNLWRETRASSTVDFAFAFPVIIAIMLGTIQLGVYLQASGTLQHALGEGIRYAKVYPDATEEQVLDEVRDEMTGMNLANIKTLTFARGTSNGADFGQLSISYSLEPMIPLVPVPAITISDSKTAYLPS